MLATRQVFSNHNDACHYAKGIASACHTYIIKGPWRALRFS
jgi:hypothetical protein